MTSFSVHEVGSPSVPPPSVPRYSSDRKSLQGPMVSHAFISLNNISNGVRYFMEEDTCAAKLHGKKSRNVSTFAYQVQAAPDRDLDGGVVGNSCEPGCNGEAVFSHAGDPVGTKFLLRVLVLALVAPHSKGGQLDLCAPGSKSHIITSLPFQNGQGPIRTMGRASQGVPRQAVDTKEAWHRTSPPIRATAARSACAPM